MIIHGSRVAQLAERECGSRQSRNIQDGAGSSPATATNNNNYGTSAIF